MKASLKIYFQNLLSVTFTYFLPIITARIVNRGPIGKIGKTPNTPIILAPSVSWSQYLNNKTSATIQNIIAITRIVIKTPMAIPSNFLSSSLSLGLFGSSKDSLLLPFKYRSILSGLSVQDWQHLTFLLIN